MRTDACPDAGSGAKVLKKARKRRLPPANPAPEASLPAQHPRARIPGLPNFGNAGNLMVVITWW
jgi:hypothetical protein